MPMTPPMFPPVTDSSRNGRGNRPATENIEDLAAFYQRILELKEILPSLQIPALSVTPVVRLDPDDIATAMAALPAPQVTVNPEVDTHPYIDVAAPDLSELNDTLQEMVDKLQPVSAEDIAAAIGNTPPPPPREDNLAPVLEKLAKSLEKMDTRLRAALSSPGVAMAGDLLPPSTDGTTQASVESSTSTVTLAPAASNKRHGVTVHNDSTADLYLYLGAGASTTQYTVKMAANSYYETPYGYRGIITGVWSAANGFARVTELS